MAGVHLVFLSRTQASARIRAKKNLDAYDVTDERTIGHADERTLFRAQAKIHEFTFIITNHDAIIDAPTHTLRLFDICDLLRQYKCPTGFL